MEKAGQYPFPILSGIFFIPAEQPAKWACLQVHFAACRQDPNSPQLAARGKILRSLPPGGKILRSLLPGPNPPQFAVRGQNPPQFAAGYLTYAAVKIPFCFFIDSRYTHGSFFRPAHFLAGFQSIAIFIFSKSVFRSPKTFYVLSIW